LVESDRAEEGVATTGDVGLFQRVSFGTLNMWILVFAFLAYRSRISSLVAPPAQ